MLMWLTGIVVAGAEPSLEDFVALEHSRRKCATLEQLRLAPRLLRQDEVPVLPPFSNKAERDMYCGSCNTLSSDNFILRWGSGITQAQAQDVLDSFEYSWNVEIAQMGYEAPATTDSYLFNIYIGDSGSGTPAGYGAAGYFTGDQQGFPMIVLAKQTVWDEYYLDGTIAHEFFHALQSRTNRYDYDEYGPGAWYWEATANWAESVVYPDEVGMAYFLVGYTYFPHYPVNFFDYPNESLLQEYHQYGAFIFPLHLTEIEASNQIIRSSWQDQSALTDPMDVLDKYLQADGTTIEEAWLNHIARMTVMDYRLGNAYEQYLSYYRGYPESQNRYAATVTQSGSNGWTAGPSATKPQRFGHNTIIARNLSASSMTFAIRGESTGSKGSTAIYGGTVTKVRGNTVTYHPLEFSGRNGDVTLSGIQSGDEYYLTVGVWTSAWDPNKIYSETFDYEYRISAVDGVASEPSGEPANEPSVPAGEPSNDLVPGLNDDEDVKAGCSMVSDLELGWFAGVGILGLYRRRS